MKDFADLANSSGAFPSVIGVDASGPGETDGTELTADLFNDLMGAFQALLNDQSETPSGSAESGSGTSQILNAIKFLAVGSDLIPNSTAKPTFTAGVASWNYILQVGNAYYNSRVNSVYIDFPANLPIGVSIDIDISVYIVPGAMRAGVNRTNVGLYYRTYGSSTDTLIGSIVYDDGTANAQTIVVPITSLTPLKTRQYLIKIQAGNTGAASPDSIYSVKREISLA